MRTFGFNFLPNNERFVNKSVKNCNALVVFTSSKNTIVFFSGNSNPKIKSIIFFSNPSSIKLLS